MRTPLAEPAERGRLDIHPTVLRKIVEHAADSVPGTLRNERTLAGIDVTHVPYRGTGPALNDLLGGQISLLWTAPPGLE